MSNQAKEGKGFSAGFPQKNAPLSRQEEGRIQEARILAVEGGWVGGFFEKDEFKKMNGEQKKMIFDIFGTDDWEEARDLFLTQWKVMIKAIDK